MLEKFSKYLAQHEYSETTIDSYCKAVSKFLSWCDRKSYEVEVMTYAQWMQYQEHIKSRTNKYGQELKDRSVAHTIGTIRLFFEFLIFEDLMSDSPIKDRFYKVDPDFYHDHLSQIELRELYLCYNTQNLKHPKCPSVAIRNKVIIGLVVFQAIDTTTLQRLTPDHIDLNKGKISVPGTSRSNPRVLQLEDVQIGVLRQYLEHDREVLQRKINCSTEALFPLNTKRFSCITADITGKLKAMNLKVTNLRQLRASVITIWVKKYDLRRTQIMAGHRYISSTENYMPTDMDALEEETKKYHPLA
ncbi:MAG: tyrosine-type recombinase/integrase [bacterium]